VINETTPVKFVQSAESARTTGSYRDHFVTDIRLPASAERQNECPAPKINQMRSPTAKLTECRNQTAKYWPTHQFHFPKIDQPPMREISVCSNKIIHKTRHPTFGNQDNCDSN